MAAFSSFLFHFFPFCVSGEARLLLYNFAETHRYSFNFPHTHTTSSRLTAAENFRNIHKSYYCHFLQLFCIARTPPWTMRTSSTSSPSCDHHTLLIMEKKFLPRWLLPLFFVCCSNWEFAMLVCHTQSENPQVVF